MARTIPQRELRNARIMDAVVAGETFLITRSGQPIAELRPILHAGRTFVPKTDLLAAAATGPSLDADAFRRDLDRVIDQSL